MKDADQEQSQPKLFKIRSQYRNADGGIDERQLKEDIRQYSSEDLEVIVAEFMRRLEQVTPDEWTPSLGADESNQ